MPKTMRAALLDAAGDATVLRIGEAPTPDRVNAEFLVKVVAAGVNPLDASTRSGLGVFDAIHSFPAVLGHDFSGVVVESPFAAHPLRPGDEVFGMVMVPRFGGSYAEYVSVPSVSLVRKPATLSHIEAAAAPHAALTAWGMVVELAKAHEGQRVLVHAGTGAVGHFAIQFAAYFGAHVIATTPSTNHSWLRALGAAEVVDEAATGYDPTGLGDTVDVVIDPSPELDRATRALALIRPGGLLVLHVPAGVDPGLAEAAEAAGVRATGYTGAPDGSTLAVIARLLETGSVRVHVDRIFPLDEIAEAHRALEHEHTRGAIVLKVAEG
ncbi:NADP-dependent oxidoreductase [Leifsonia shinshuensis]|uniref:NADPH:quinone reductase-like Zn-dependent oxidoreductase n=1 Tax=Leifsonia shinshuensis TaxID=150026 RepID=A0A853D1F2_9MICO|nr:NADP-dependent oxidoreductase [Leifsonia shinshuensis]NYJ25311.1 NADPH:quinone reductase-like Zn-dependent oxidoreductase [Leifsonia shinshuensis]